MLDKNISRSYVKALFHATGKQPGHMDKARVGIGDSTTSLAPGHCGLGKFVKAIKNGITEAGGEPYDFPVMALCDGIAQGKGMHGVLPSREIIAATVETTCLAYDFDALVLVGACDKVLPGMLMAAARLNLPTIFFTSGLMEAGRFKGNRVVASDVKEGIGAAAKGELSLDDLKELEKAACPGPGVCNMMGTANTMRCLIEGAGLSLPKNATTLIADPELLDIAFTCGRKSVPGIPGYSYSKKSNKHDHHGTGHRRVNKHGDPFNRPGH